MFTSLGQRAALKILPQIALSSRLQNQLQSYLFTATSGALGPFLQSTGAQSSTKSLREQLIYNRFSHTWGPCQVDRVTSTISQQSNTCTAALSARWFSSSKLKPKHVGGKLKVYSSFKERFKLTATGRVKYMPPGHRHKRSAKSADQNRKLRHSSMLFTTYAKTMKKLGFRMTSY